MNSLIRRCILGLSLCAAAHAADIVATGSCVETISSADLISGAGSGILNPESGSGVTTLSVSSTIETWRVKARLSNGSWNGNVSIWVKRSSNGSGSGSIAGGTGYIQLTSTDQELFSGTLDRSSISLQMKVTGLTPLVPPGTYQSPIIFTVVSP